MYICIYVYSIYKLCIYNKTFIDKEVQVIILFIDIDVCMHIYIHTYVMLLRNKTC